LYNLIHYKPVQDKTEPVIIYTHMMSRLIKFGLIFSIILISCICCVQKSPQWMEGADRFFTLDIKRAQEEIPFTILFPSYLPNIQGDMRLVGIEGILKEYQNEGRALIIMVYSAVHNASIIEISEFNYPVTSVNPDINPGLEKVNMQNKEVIRDIGNDGSVYFYFNHDGIYYIIHFEYIPFEETEKVVESMLKQL
jgi:hypothetical protein